MVKIPYVHFTWITNLKIFIPKRNWRGTEFSCKKYKTIVFSDDIFSFNWLESSGFDWILFDAYALSLSFFLLLPSFSLLRSLDDEFWILVSTNSQFGLKCNFARIFVCFGCLDKNISPAQLFGAGDTIFPDVDDLIKRSIHNSMNFTTLSILSIIYDQNYYSFHRRKT